MKSKSLSGLVTGIALVVALVLSGCGPTPTPTPTGIPTPTSTPTPTPTPTTTPTPTATPIPNVILIGWDGAQRNHVKESLSRGELPNLEKLSAEGALVAIDIYRVTDTKAGWSQILTGYEPEVSGVFSNSIYQPIPIGYTVFERLESYFGQDNFATVAVIGKKDHVDNDAPRRMWWNQGDTLQPGEKKVIENGVTYRDTPGKPYYNATPVMDAFINGLGQNDVVGAKALEVLDQYKEKPFFFFIHFADIDSKGHGFGQNSQEYNDALISADTWTGRIIQKLKDLGLYDNTLIYVTSDHGFDEGLKSHSDAPYVFLATNDHQVMRRGERADIAPTILERFGLDLTSISPPLDGHPLTRPDEMPLW